MGITLVFDSYCCFCSLDGSIPSLLSIYPIQLGVMNKFLQQTDRIYLVRIDHHHQNIH